MSHNASQKSIQAQKNINVQLLFKHVSVKHHIVKRTLLCCYEGRKRKTAKALSFMNAQQTIKNVNYGYLYENKPDLFV